MLPAVLSSPLLARRFVQSVKLYSETKLIAEHVFKNHNKTTPATSIEWCRFILLFIFKLIF